MPELSRRPYLLRAMLDWMVDCGYTPHLIVDASSDAVQVPRQFVKEGKIVLNISASATQSFQIGSEAVEFSARFGGVSHRICVPVDYVLGIYARETGQGMVFTDDASPVPDAAGNSSDGGAPTDPPPPAPDKPRRPSLKVVK
ncbi:MAG TPA: ClpXP protease specificity-enhancing factor [Steroidobacteraceae bacterium]|nr:ClpXP protease specificity-enhancing factor [Steroidobacteraceae bacterium]